MWEKLTYGLTHAYSLCGPDGIEFVSQNGAQCLKDEFGGEIIDCLRQREPLLFEMQHNRSIFNPTKCRYLNWPTNNRLFDPLNKKTTFLSSFFSSLFVFFSKCHLYRIHWQSNKCVVKVFERCTNRSASTKRLVQGFINAAMNQTECQWSSTNAVSSNKAHSSSYQSPIHISIVILLLFSLVFEY